MADESLSRSEFFAQLAAYRAGEMSLADFIGWEAQYALDDDVEQEMRTVLDRLALLAAEATDNIRPESELRELVAELLQANTVPRL